MSLQNWNIASIYLGSTCIKDLVLKKILEPFLIDCSIYAPFLFCVCNHCNSVFENIYWIIFKYSLTNGTWPRKPEWKSVHRAVILSIVEKYWKLCIMTWYTWKSWKIRKLLYVIKHYQGDDILWISEMFQFQIWKQVVIFYQIKKTFWHKTN